LFIACNFGPEGFLFRVTSIRVVKSPWAYVSLSKSAHAEMLSSSRNRSQPEQLEDSHRLEYLGKRKPCFQKACWQKQVYELSGATRALATEYPGQPGQLHVLTITHELSHESKPQPSMCNTCVHRHFCATLRVDHMVSAKMVTVALKYVQISLRKQTSSML